VAGRACEPPRGNGHRTADRVPSADRVRERTSGRGRSRPKLAGVPVTARAEDGGHDERPADRGEDARSRPADEPAGDGQRAGRDPGQPPPLRPRRIPPLPPRAHQRLDGTTQRGRRPPPLDRGERLPRAEDADRRPRERQQDRRADHAAAARRAARSSVSAARQRLRPPRHA
jgi:hypothetical protein